MFEREARERHLFTHDQPQQQVRKIHVYNNRNDIVVSRAINVRKRCDTFCLELMTRLRWQPIRPYSWTITLEKVGTGHVEMMSSGSKRPRMLKGGDLINEAAFKYDSRDTEESREHPRTQVLPSAKMKL